MSHLQRPQSAAAGGHARSLSTGDIRGAPKKEPVQTRKDPTQDAKHKKILTALIASAPANNKCVDCGSPGPRWASVNLGLFICINCAGVHRSMGTHISKVRSVDMDTWLPSEIECITRMGNVRGKAVWEAKFEGAKPTAESGMGILSQWIRNKYERKAFLDREMLAEIESGAACLPAVPGLSEPDEYRSEDTPTDGVRKASSGRRHRSRRDESLASSAPAIPLTPGTPTPGASPFLVVPGATPSPGAPTARSGSNLLELFEAPAAAAPAPSPLGSLMDLASPSAAPPAAAPVAGTLAGASLLGGLESVDFGGAGASAKKAPTTSAILGLYGGAPASNSPTASPLGAFGASSFATPTSAGSAAARAPAFPGGGAAASPMFAGTTVGGHPTPTAGRPGGGTSLIPGMSPLAPEKSGTSGGLGGLFDGLSLSSGSAASTPTRSGAGGVGMSPMGAGATISPAGGGARGFMASTPNYAPVVVPAGSAATPTGGFSHLGIGAMGSKASPAAQAKTGPDAFSGLAWGSS